MKLRKPILVLIFLTNAFVAPAQMSASNVLEFHAMFGRDVVNCDGTWFKLSDTDSIQFSALRFYISDIELLNDEKAAWHEANGFHLIDASNRKSLKIILNSPDDFKFNKIRFNLGIDSVTNVSGAMGGDLDPTAGMYWTWQSGYINFKLEGRSNKCKSRNNEFQFHLGGYQYPDNALRTLVFNVDKKHTTVIILDVAKLISESNLENQDHIMSPGAAAMEFTDKAINNFSSQ